MAEITQVIPEITNIPDRINDTQEEFTENSILSLEQQATFSDAINTFSGQANAVRDEMVALDANVTSNASTSASNASAAQSSADAAAASEAGVAADALAAENSASAAATSETNAAASELAASNSETAAATSETNAANSELNAAASELAASNSESNANSSENSAASSAVSAGSSATNAEQSALEAEASAQAAASSATIVGAWEDAAGAADAFTSYTYQSNSVWMLAVEVTNIAATEPSSDNPDWIVISRPFESIPYPDLHIPFNDGLRIESGYGTHDQIDVSALQDGSVMVDLPSKSVNFSRSSISTAINKSGVLERLSSGEAGIGSDGIWLHSAFTNIMLYSEFDGGYPLGTSTQWTSTTDAGGLTFGYYESSSTTTTAIPYTADSDLSCSVFVYGNTGRQRIRFSSTGVGFRSRDLYIDLSDGSVELVSVYTGWSHQVERVSDGIWRVHCFYDASQQLLGNSLVECSCFPKEDGSYGYYGGFQVVEGSIAKFPYIETTSTTETVASATASLPAEGNLPVKGKPFSIIWDVALLPNAPIARAFFETYGDGRISAYVTAQNILTVSSSSGGNVTGLIELDGISKRFIASFDEDSGLSVYVNGDLVGYDSGVVLDVDFENIIAIGSLRGLGLWHLNGQIKNFKIIHSALTAAQVATIGVAE